VLRDFDLPDVAASLKPRRVTELRNGAIADWPRW
jgi:hypothetical protein